jgi:hypothetical protein
MIRNPFRIHGVVSRPDFTDREPEVQRMREILADPGTKLLVYGERRMGKTSALSVAVGEHIEAGGLACLADFSTATSHADLANRILGAATKALGRRWRDIALDLAGRIGVSLEAGIDPGTQLPTASFSVGVRDASATEQRRTLARVLDAIEGICEERDASLGLVLDEFQEIHRFGGEEAEWHLRGIIQHHRRLSYIAAGSRTHLIRRMIAKGGAFYKLFDVLHFGPLDEDHLAAWIDARLRAAGLEGGGMGREMIRLAGPRTRDVVQLARKTFELGNQDASVPVDPSCVARAFVEVVQDESEPLRALWAGYSAAQARVLRAVAAGGDALTAADTLRRFGLRSSAAAVQAAASLLDQGALVQVGPGAYRFDSPFQRGWVVMHALPDVGIHLPPTHPGP